MVQSYIAHSIALQEACVTAQRVREPGPMKHGGTPIAFIEDPNGYKIELIDLTRRTQAG
jgi:hypothetical protein